MPLGLVLTKFWGMGTSAGLPDSAVSFAEQCMKNKTDIQIKMFGATGFFLGYGEILVSTGSITEEGTSGSKKFLNVHFVF